MSEIKNLVAEIAFAGIYLRGEREILWEVGMERMIREIRERKIWSICRL